MPAYNTPPNHISIYPGQNAYPVGYAALPGASTSALTSDRYESVSQSYKSIPICVASGMDYHGFTQRQITWVISYGSTVASVSVVLQGSIDDVDADYVTVDTSTSTTGESRTSNVTNYRFFRIIFNTLTTGAIPTIVKITAM